ncbi:CAR1 transcription factor isoform X2 [Pseudomyrmex gracilis]|uniref:CAR1 transcription factor isoform X2 n=1 Tax=Pseudomyrmex gracilis TaxID=219809 RepID=UPI000994923E|nr:CAR1 transcription factor isoform X2 [Pseudomyrmex gracilis]
MEKRLVDNVADSEDSSTISCISGIEDSNEISKEKEDELLYNGEDGEEGDDEDVLSDDSLRLRLSDDDDGDTEQHDTKNLPNISELKLQDQKTEQPATCVILDKELCSTLAQTVEEGTKINEESLDCDSAIDTLDKTIIFNESEKHMSNNSPENISITVGELLDGKYSSESNTELTISEISNACSKVTSEHVKLKTDNLSTNNYVQPSNLQKLVLEPHNEDNLKKTASDHKEISSPCKSKVNNVIDPVKVTMCNNEKSFTVTTVSDSTEGNLNDKVISEANTNNNNSANHSLVDEINNSENSTKDNNINDISKDHVKYKYENQQSKHEDIIQSKTEKTQSIQEEVQEQNDNVKYRTTTSTEDSDTNKFCSDSISTLKTNSVTSSNIVELMEIENKTEDANAFQEKVSFVSSMENTKNTNKNIDVIASRKKRAKRDIIPEYIIEDDKKERQKRKTAKNAEEIIRKKYLNNDSDSTETDEEDVTVKSHRDVRSASPSLKRNCLDKSESFNGVKKVKIGDNTETAKSTAKNDIVKLAFVEKLYQRDVKETLKKLTQKELEEFVIQKIAETITMRSEIGQLREQARITEKLHEATRTKLQQLMKQMKDFEMVLSRNAADRRLNGDKPVAPIKINRSVGLQVNFITEHGMQNLRQVQQVQQVQQVSLLKPPTNVPISSPSFEPNSNVPKRGNGVKIRSPRPLAPAPTTSTTSQNPVPPIIPTVTPAALVVAKPLDSSQMTKPIGVQPILSAPSTPQQTIVLNGNIQGQIKCPPLIASKLNNDLIDLTDEEEKNKSTVKVTTVTANSMTTNTVVDHTLTTKPAQAQAFSRLIQTIPANVTITTPPTNLRLIAPNPATPTAIVIRPVTTCNRPFSTVTYKAGAGISTIANGNVRVVNTATPPNLQHPAPLPDTPAYTVIPGWKLPPPAPSLKITKVSNGIVLSWNMSLSDMHADIVSYQLYAYQEIPGVNASTSLWKKVGDVRALPLPMACTLTQFSEGNNYYFAVRAVDTHSRKGQYSTPGNISL